MKRILFDTNIYGKLEADPDTLRIIKEKYQKEFVIYGCSTIRNELRNIPRKIKHEKRKVRILLLDIYDSFITKENHNLKYNKLVETLTNAYIKEYKKKKKSLSEETIKNDFIIIATATIYQLEIIVSADKSSMFSENAVESYKKINILWGMKNPSFMVYEEFKQKLKEGFSSG